MYCCLETLFNESIDSRAMLSHSIRGYRMTFMDCCIMARGRGRGYILARQLGYTTYLAKGHRPHSSEGEICAPIKWFDDAVGDTPIGHRSRCPWENVPTPQRHCLLRRSMVKVTVGSVSEHDSFIACCWTLTRKVYICISGASHLRQCRAAGMNWKVYVMICSSAHL